MWDAAARQAIMQFLDGTWRLCRLIEWRQHDAATWLCDLRWGVSDRIVQAAYVYDQARVQPVTTSLFEHPAAELPVDDSAQLRGDQGRLHNVAIDVA
jgi:hypothetical protein